LVESKVGFFNRGKTMACFCAAGRTADWNEQLHREVITGAKVYFGFKDHHLTYTMNDVLLLL